MIDKQFEWNIDGIQANTVLEGAEVNIPIEKYNYKYIFSTNKILNEMDNFDSYLQGLFKTDNNGLTREISYLFNLSYLIKDDMYYIGFDYNTIFNNVLSFLKMDRNIKVNKVTNNDEYNALINQIKNEIKAQFFVKFQTEFKEWDRYELLIVNNLYRDIDKLLKYMIKLEQYINKLLQTQIDEERILRDNKKSLKNVENKNIKWKNLMYYTASKSLNIFKETKDKRYYKYAKNYYLNVSRDKRAEFPESFTLDGEWMDYQYNSFNNNFIRVQRSYFSSLDVKLGIEDLDIVNGTLHEGIKNISISGEGKSKKRKIDYSKINEKTDRKIKFYRGLKGKVRGIIKKPLSADLNYIGFVLDNNYVIYDKFYEVSRDGKSVKIAYDNAVYVVSLDVAVACHFDKGEIRKYIKKYHDYKAFRLYHNDSDSYQNKINEVLDYSDVSTIKFNELKLINKKRD